MSNKRFLSYVFSLAFLMMLGVCALLFAYDALAFWHKPWGREMRFSQEMRQQIKGIIKHFDFDSIIVGDSLTEAVPAGYLDQKVGGNWVNLSAPGTSFYEKYIFLNYAFNHKDIKAIFYGFGSHGSVDIDEVEDVSNYDFLYDENPFNDMKYYINRKFLSCALTWSSSAKCLKFPNDLENLRNWMSDDNATKHLGGYLKWFGDNKEALKNEIAKLDAAIKKGYEIKPYKESLDKNKAYIKKWLFSLIQAHPQTRFYLVLPTFSLYHYRLTDPSYYAKWEAIIRWLVQESKDYKNIEIYSLATLPYANDLANYKDAIHHEMTMDVMQVDAIASKAKLDSSNVSSFLSKLESQIKNYDLQGLKNSLEKRLKELD